MPKEEWGVKRGCPKCATRFFDLQNDPMTCPSCEHTFDLASLTQTKSRTIAPQKVEKPQEEPAPEAAEDDIDVLEAEDDSESENVDIGDDLLEEEEETVNLEEIADMPANEDES